MLAQARTVIIGAGIVGCSAAAELAARGETGIVVVDRGDLPRTGGSTSHAPGLVFQNNGSRTVSKLAQWTVEAYRDLSQEGPGCYFPVGSLEIATTPERLTDLHRKAGFGTSWGLDARVIGPDDVRALVPQLDTSLVLGAIQVQGDGLVRAVTASDRLAARARVLGVEFLPGTMVTGIEIERGAVRAVTTDRGRIACERVLACGGIWSPLLGDLAGIDLPLQPCAHPYVRTTPIDQLRGMDGIVQPIWRHQDHSMYLWQEGDRMGIGNYRHAPHLVPPEQIDNTSPAPADLPFDDAMMEPGRREAERLVPALRGAGITDRVYGMFSFTPDAQSLVGEVATVRGLWTAVAVWVTHAAGTGRAIAQLMTEGDCELDLREVDVNRFTAHQGGRRFVEMRGDQQYREVYDIIHPKEQIDRPRNLRRAPWFAQQQALEARFFESNGWERVQWYEANATLPMPELGAIRDPWSARGWSPIAGAEHRATRERAGLFDLSTFMRIEVEGPGAARLIERISPVDLSRIDGRAAYVVLLNPHGGIESDMTLAKMGDERYLLMTGSGSGPRDLGILRRAARDEPGTIVRDATSGWAALGIWGPRSVEILAPLAEGDLSLAAFPRYRVRQLMVAGIPAMLVRMSYVGEEGFEVHVPTEYGGALWEALMEAGAPHGLVAAGGAAMDSLRLERGFRSLGTDLRGEYTPIEAGLEHAVSAHRSGFAGEGAVRNGIARKRLVTLALDDATRVAMGKEPVWLGSDLGGYVASGNFGFTVGRSLATAYLPVESSAPGTRVEIESFGERFGATVVADPLYDGTNRAN